jgi:hypothetical protein
VLRVRDLPLWGIIPARAFSSAQDEATFLDLVAQSLD